MEIFNTKSIKIKKYNKFVFFLRKSDFKETEFLMKIDECVGKNIKKYRRAYKMTLEELGAKIHKSKSTMSKYEKGIISLDMVTLEEVAEVFNISPMQLLASNRREYEKNKETGEVMDCQYMYSYDGRSKKILESVIERYNLPGKEEKGIQLFYDVKGIDVPGECKALYSGLSVRHEFIENYSLLNQSNPLEQIFICCINSLNRTDKRIGMVTGLSYKTMLPVVLKIMISSEKMKENQALVSQLKLTKEDIRISKKYNMFTIDRFME